MNASGQLPGSNITATPGRAVLSVEGIEKTFPGVRALSGADLSVRPGEIHALIGANGAGKSTLIRILAGLESPDAGSILVDGEPVHITNSGRSRELGLMFIHQELALIPRLSIADNLALADMPARFGVVRRTQCRRQAAAAISDSLPGVSVRTPVGELSIAQQWLVALTRVHLEAGKVVFLDEPTAALGAREVEHLFGVLRPLASSGVGIVFVSHRLDEVLEITDRVTAMRSGRTISTTPTERHDRASLVRLITGHDHVEPVRERIGDHPGGVVLEARSISSGPVRDVSLTVRAGEVLGVGGLVGSGRSELLETMCGARSLESGQLLLDGEPVRWRSPADAVRRGVALLPEDRHTMALLPRRSVRRIRSSPTSDSSPFGTWRFRCGDASTSRPSRSLLDWGSGPQVGPSSSTSCPAAINKRSWWADGWPGTFGSSWSTNRPRASTSGARPKS